MYMGDKNEEKTTKKKGPKAEKTYARYPAIAQARADKALPRGTKAKIVDGDVQVTAPDGRVLFRQGLDSWAHDRLAKDGFKLA